MRSRNNNQQQQQQQEQQHTKPNTLTTKSTKNDWAALTPMGDQFLN
jgi:hypothetical protein